ncbi:MAG TPA: calcium-binding protein [Lacipirellulaceae bacterium]|nr:calcium-binding protein [Lacipirellulaceae bacterium]
MRRRSITTRRFELLEDRQMMAGDISFSNHILTISGASLNDVAQIRFEDDRVHVDLYAQLINGGTDHQNKTKDITDVTRVIFDGFDGNDTLNVVVNELDSDVTLNNITLEFHGGANNDRLIDDPLGGIKTFAYGEAGNDTLWGGRFDDVLEGGLGNDELHGGAGGDRYVFSGQALGEDVILSEAANVDADTLDFTYFETGVVVNLGAKFDLSGGLPLVVDSNGLRLRQCGNTAIENVFGTAFRDVITGNVRDNWLVGGDNDDVLVGAQGNDTLDGGAGDDVYSFIGGNLGIDTINEAANADVDTLNFYDFASGVNVDLTKVGPAYAVNLTNLKLVLSNDTAIENVYGSQFDDTITGNARSNSLFGFDGNDTIRGGAGADFLYGGNHDDHLFTDALDQAFGGTGLDWFDRFHEGEFIYRTSPPDRYMDWGNVSGYVYQLPPKIYDGTGGFDRTPVLPRPARPETPEVQY